MEGLVNYSSEDEPEEIIHSKVAGSVDHQDGGSGSKGADDSGDGGGSGSLKPIRRYSSSDSASKSSKDDDNEAPAYTKGPKVLEDEYRNSLAKPSLSTKHVGSRYIDDNKDKDQKYNRAPKREKERERERERNKDKDKDEIERIRKGDNRETRDHNSREISRNNREEARNYNEKNRKYEHNKRDKYDDRCESKGNHDRSYNYGKHHRYDDKYGSQRYDHKNYYESNRTRYTDRRAHGDDRHVTHGDRRDDRRGQLSMYSDCNNSSKYTSSSSSSHRYRRSPTPPSSLLPERNDSGGKRLDRRDDYYSTKRNVGSGGNGDRGILNHRSRSRSPPNSGGRFVEKSFQHTQSTHLENKHEREMDVEARSVPMTTGTGPVLGPVTAIAAIVTSKLPAARNFEHLCNVPLNNNQSANFGGMKDNTINTNATTINATSQTTAIGGGGGIEGQCSSSNFTTANMAEKPQLPSYYNPHVINPNKYAQQMQKRKLLWGAKKTDATTTAKWENAQFSEDTDGKVASKFMRLMGIKSSGSGAGEMTSLTTTNSNTSNIDQKLLSAKTSADGDASFNPSSDVKSREAMFSTMEQQYEVARVVTHTMRGVGLGFGNPSY